MISLYFNNSSAKAEFLVLANPSIPINEITKSELKQILLANKTEFEKKKVTIIALSPDIPEADAIDQEAMGMSAVQAKKYWLIKVFNGTLETTPITGDSADEVAEKVGETKGSIAVVAKGTKPGKAKIVKLK